MGHTRPEGHEVQMIEPLNETPSEKRRMSTGFLLTASALLGVIISGGIILGVVGKAFYVSRDEYTAKIVKDAEDQARLERIDRAVVRLEASVEKIADSVQLIKVDIARRR